MQLSYDLYCPSGDVAKNLPPVIMLHGMLDSKKTWKYIAPAIANRTGRNVYAVDARNHGDSPWDKDISFNLNAQDLECFLRNHGIPKAAIVGHSMGGRTAITMALNKPEYVEKIVVEDMNLRNFKPHQSGLIVEAIRMLKDSLNHIPSGVDERTAKKAVVAYFKTILPQEQKEKTPKLQSGIKMSDLSMIPLKRDGAGFSWQANLDVIQDMLTTDKIRQNLEGIFMGDALFLYGTKSFFKVDMDTLIPKMFPCASMVGIEHATHLVHFEFPDRFVEEVTTFLNGNSTTTTGLKAKY